MPIANALAEGRNGGHCCGSTETSHAGCHSVDTQINASELVQLQLGASNHDAYLPGNVLPILHEIAAMLAVLTASGEANSIDLRRSPLSPIDYEALKGYLGQGEVSAQSNSLGPTHILETSVSGVWWITHRNQDDEIVGEFIEVTACPEMLVTPFEDLLAGLSRLRERLASESQIVNPNDVKRSLAALGVSNSDILNDHRDLNPLRLDPIH